MNTSISSLTPNEKAVLSFISDFISKNRMSPTFTEIQKSFGYSSVNSVQNYIRQLEKKGYLELEPHQKRAIRLVAAATDFGKEVELSIENSIEIEVSAKVAAGRPLEYQIFDKSVRVDKGLLPKSGSFFAVQVSGDSMLEAGILDGDVLILSKLSSPYPGVTAVVSIQDEGATVKKVYPKPSLNSFELRPANSNYQSRVVSEANLRFEGQLVAMVRKY